MSGIAKALTGMAAAAALAVGAAACTGGGTPANQSAHTGSTASSAVSRPSPSAAPHYLTITPGNGAGWPG